MKRMLIIFAMLLWIAAVFAGCNQQTVETTQPTQITQPTSIPVPTKPKRPTEREMAVLQQYVDIVKYLWTYEGPNSKLLNVDFQGYRDQDALIACRNWLLQHPEVDQWEEFIPTYWDGNFNWNRQEILSRFSCLDDVALGENYTDYDESDPVNERIPLSLSRYSYDTDGKMTRRTSPSILWKLITFDPAEGLNHALLIYDEQAVLRQIINACYPDDPHRSIRYTVYDEAGKLIGLDWEWEGKTARIEYTYDEQGRITKVYSPAYPGSGDYSVATYCYDDHGNMIRKEERSYNARIASQGEGPVEWMVVVTEYSYDADGVLRSGTRVDQDWDYGVYFDPETNTNEYGQHLKYEIVDSYQFGYDDLGRLKTMLIKNGDSYHMTGAYAGQMWNEAVYDCQLIEVIYGQYWFFNGK